MVNSTGAMLQLPAFILPALPCVLEQPPPLPPRNELIHFQKTPHRPLPAAGTPGARGASAFCGGAGAARTQVRTGPRGPAPWRAAARG